MGNKFMIFILVVILGLSSCEEISQSGPIPFSRVIKTPAGFMCYRTNFVFTDGVVVYKNDNTDVILVTSSSSKIDCQMNR